MPLSTSTQGHSAGQLPAELKLTASVAAGLVNRHFEAPAVAALSLPADQLWLTSARNIEPSISDCTWKPLSLPQLVHLAYTSGEILSRRCMQ